MLKKEKTFYTVAGFILAVVLSIVLCLTLMLTGVIKLNGDKLVVCSGSAEKAYDGTPLTCAETWVENPEKLKEGHSVQASTYGFQTEKGFSRNSFAVRVVDQNGNDVSGEYKINQKAGILYVHDENWMDLDLDNLDIDPSLLEQLLQNIGSFDVNSYLKDKDFDLGNMSEIMGSGEYDLDDFTPEQLLAGLLAGGSLIDQLEENPGEEEGGGNEGEEDSGEEGGEGKTGGSGNGTSGMGGSFSSEISKSGDGSDGTEQGELLKVTSTKNGTLYMRFENFGDYNGTGWNAATPFDLSVVTPLNLTASALAYSGYTFEQVSVEVLTEPMYYLPQYTVYEGDNPDDIKIHEKVSLYSVNSAYYDYLTSDFSINIPSYQITAEQIYSTHAYSQYSNIDSDLKSKLLDITRSEFIDKTGKELIQAIASYVQNSATYNLEFSEFPEDKDMILYFLTEGKEGICQHFASAATMLYRAYGIPARYTVGCVAHTIANQQITVTGENAHAWVEVYVDGLGWVTVEVTGGDNGGDESVIEKPIIEIVTFDNSKNYDGTPLYAVKEGYSVLSPERLKDGHEVRCITPDLELPNITEIGEKENSLNFGIFEGNTDVSEQYEIEVTKGMLRVYGIELNIQTNSAEKVYDGTPLTATAEFGQNVSGGYWYDENVMVEGHKLVVDENYNLPSITNVGDILNDIKFKVIDGADKDVSAYYDLNVNAGYLMVNSRVILVETATYEWVYDGEEHSNDDFINPQGLVAGHVLVATEEPTIKNVGSITNDLGFKVYEKFGTLEQKDVSENYYIICTGTLTVNNRVLYIESQSKEEYVSNGVTEIQWLFYKSDSVSGLVPGHRIEVVDGPIATLDNNDIPNVLTYKIYDDSLPEGEKDVTNNYQINEKLGMLSLIDNTTELIIKLGSAKGYMPSYVFTEEYTFESGEIKSGHKLVPVYPDGSIPTLTEVGTIPNDYEFKVVIETTGEDVSNQYKIIVKPGVLELYYASLTVISLDMSKNYDGEVLDGSWSSHSLPQDVDLAQGHRIVDVEYTKITVGTAINEIKFRIVDADNNDVTKYYKINEDFGTLEVVPIKINITTPSKTITEKEFENIPEGVFYCDEGYVIEIEENLVGLTVTYNGERTQLTLADAGVVHSNVLGFDFKDGNGNQLDSKAYNAVYNNGVLKITDDRITLKIRTASAEKLDDGTPLWTTNGFEIISATSDAEVERDEDGILKKGHRIVLDPNSEHYAFSILKKAGAKLNHRLEKIIDEDGNNVIGDYIIEYEENGMGILWIYKYVATVTTGTMTFNYDGTAHSYCADGTYSVAGIQPGHVAKVVGNPTSITNVGITVDNRFTVKMLNAGEHDYKINYRYGKLKVEPKVVMATTFVQETGTSDKTVYYETEESVMLKFDAEEIIIGGLVDGHKVTAILTQKVIDGEFTILEDSVSEVVIYDAKGNNVTKNYTISFDRIGKLIALPK